MSVISGCIFRKPRLEDGGALYQLIQDCPPLDVNSSYLYFILCDHFRHSSVVVECDEKIVGCITGYRRPDKPDTLFVWQVAVHEKMRGQKLAGQMLNELLFRDKPSGISWIETTVSPSNIPSRKLFERWAADQDVPITSVPYLTADDFPASPNSDSHEAEDLFRIGPLSLP